MKILWNPGKCLEGATVLCTVIMARGGALCHWLGRISIGVGAVLSTVPAAAHEAWLLTPSEEAALAEMPLPPLFLSVPALLGAALIGGLIALVALSAEDRYSGIEERLLAPLRARAAAYGPLAIRIGLASMMVGAAAGALPRHGTAMWAEPTLFVPDMQLSMVEGWGWLAFAQLVLAVFLAAGLFTRAAAAVVILLALLGLAVFGDPFLSYAPHFAAPALVLLAFGGGAASADRVLGTALVPEMGAKSRTLLWHLALLATGGTFVYLAIVYKLTQPTLLIAILSHAQFPTFGVPLPWVALAMMWVELIAGALLAIGRLVRPIALLLIGAFTFFAVVLGETPLFHANLYGLMAMLILAGRHVPVPAAPQRAALA